MERALPPAVQLGLKGIAMNRENWTRCVMIHLMLVRKLPAGIDFFSRVKCRAVKSVPPPPFCFNRPPFHAAPPTV